ncbi:MAG TPA: hypothetical protein VLN26_02935 [Gaiellaceae bacterium]|nr:hypothetical protein [Gaiellaceae bacterium]
MRRGVEALRAVLVAAGVVTALAATAAGRAAPPQHVTLIGDSVADSLQLDASAARILAQGIDLDLEVAPCRRVGGESCPYQGARPANVIQLVQSMGSRIGPNVIVAVGYNDPEDGYAQNIEDALAAMRQAGVKRVLWLTLRAAAHPYLSMNDGILAAAAAHPELTVVDWNLYSRSHPDWFQADGIHLLGPGADSMASLLHTTLVSLGIAAAPATQKPPAHPVRVATAALPVAVKGERYAAKLKAVAGRPPYFWSFPRRPPKGLHLRPTGWVFGRPAGRPGTFVLEVRVADAVGGSAVRKLQLRVR